MHRAGQESSRSPKALGRAELLWDPLPLVTLFILLSLLWIAGTDFLVRQFVMNTAAAQLMQTGKGFVWILLSAALLYYSLKRARDEQRELNAQIRAQQDELEQRVRVRTENLRRSREELRLLTRRLDQAAESERKRISRELHDQMGSELTALKIDLKALQDTIPSGQHEAAERLASALALVDSLYRGLRSLASELRPGILDDLGLIAAIQWLAAEFRKRSGSRCECKVDISDRDLPPDESRDTALFRICQESLTNVLKHAAATEVRISVAITSSNVRLIVEDNGRGMREPEDGSARQLGLVGIEERAIAIGGTASIESKEGGGTRIRVDVPLQTAVREAAT